MHWGTKNISVAGFIEIFALLLWSRTKPVISPMSENLFKIFDTRIWFQVRNYYHVPVERDENWIGRVWEGMGREKENHHISGDIIEKAKQNQANKNLRYSGHSLKDSENYGSQDSEHTDWKLIIY